MAPPGGWFAYALDKGWHLGPIGAEDEHGTEWAQPQWAKTVILAQSRDAASLKDAMLARALLRAGPSLQCAAAGFQRDRCVFIGSGGQVLQASNGAQASLQVSAVGSEEEWVFVRIIDLADADGDEVSGEAVAVSAPIWFRAAPS